MSASQMITVETITWPTAAERSLEVVERKGIGHPDTICDEIMERISCRLCRAYRESFGAILHHNCDKGLLVAGRAEHRFGGGRVLEPMRLIVGDRATSTFRGRSIDVPGIAREAAREWLTEHLPNVDPVRHVEYQIELRPGSEALTGLFARDAAVPGANDTSVGVGYAPLSETEALVLHTERYLNGTDFEARFPGTGQDVKVMGVRRGRALSLTVAMPLLDRGVRDEADYFARRAAIREDLLGELRARLVDLQAVEVTLNALDRPGLGVEGAYLSVTGTCAEDADSGQVGRGNRVNGLIAFARPQTLEAAAGKNPVNHVGKIYNVLAHRIADLVVQRVDPVRAAVVWLVSRIGQPIDRPQTAAVQLHLEPDVGATEVEEVVRELTAAELGRVRELTEELADARYAIA